MKLLTPLGVLVTLVILSPALTAAEIKLYGLDSPGRVAGSFFVVFKTDAELAAIPHKGPNAPTILPGLLPKSKKSARRLAEALCAQIHAQLAGLLYIPSHTSFVVHDASDSAIRDVLAKDPRIAEIGANFPMHY